MRYAIVIEKAATIEETEREIQAAILLHLEGLRADGLPVPEPK